MGTTTQSTVYHQLGLSIMSLDKRHAPLNQEELEEHKVLRKSLRERIKQLRMVEYIDDDEEPEIFLDVS